MNILREFFCSYWLKKNLPPENRWQIILEIRFANYNFFLSMNLNVAGFDPVH